MSAKDIGRVTPMMEQFIEIKKANPGSLLFYRMGDFYELFFDDAIEASKALGITLTKRGKHQGDDIPMCGVPVHAADDYLQRLIALKYRVAVCEQMENPAEAKKRGAKSVVKRDVVRLVTPGTLTEDRLLDAGRNNYFAALARLKAGGQDGLATYGLAFIDISTGEFFVTSCDLANVGSELTRVEPSELIVSDSMLNDPDLAHILDRNDGSLTPLPKAFFDSSTAEKKLAEFFRVQTLEGFGDFSRVELSAAAAAVSYVDKTQLGERPRLSPPSRQHITTSMIIDAATRANLELVRTLSGEQKGSLLSTIDFTVTGAGGRLLASRLASPGTELSIIQRRQKAVGYLLSQTGLRLDLHSALRTAPDMPRAISRIALGRGGPRDLLAIRAGYEAAANISHLLSMVDRELPKELENVLSAIRALPAGLGELLDKALLDDVPLLARDGGFVQKGYREDLDEARSLRDESRKIIAGLQTRYAALSEVKSLKVKHNNVLGYFFEVPTAYGNRLMSEPLNETFIHRQTLASAARFTTTDLADLDARIANAANQATGIELEVFSFISEAILSHAEILKSTAQALAVLDVSLALARLAEEKNYNCPVVVEGYDFEIEGGRHPVVEAALEIDGAESFVANSCNLGPTADNINGQIWLLTGPNMAGKSTFLRQNALIAILAQMGSFVPARSARIGIIDRLFCRVGAADDLARGRSTFMVEMVETAVILNQATPRSLVILDEIGRGTATFDGLSIAWAAVEHLHEINKSRALFATHYHEMTVLQDKLPRLENATVRVKEWKGDVVFLHEIISGAADRSYGIQVAKLAGLPGSVIVRAKEVLALLEEGDRHSPSTTLIDDLPLFSVMPRQAVLEPVKDHPALLAMKDINPDDLSPKEALDILYRVKDLVNQSEDFS